MRNNPKTMLVLNFMDTYMRLKGYSPTRREIAVAMLNGHTNASQHYITKLKQDDFIVVGDKGHRAISVTQKGKLALSEWRQVNESDIGETA